jgi:hypothetical protein
MAMVEGLARHVQLREGARGVLRFEVELQSGRRMPVRMRGARMEGALNDGDNISFEAELDEHGVASPQRVSNLSNGSTIELRPESVAHRLRSIGEHPVVSSILSGVLVFLLTLPFTVGSSSDRSPARPPPTTSASPPIPAPPAEGGSPQLGSPQLGILLSLALGIVAASVVFVWAARRRGRRAEVG